MFDNYTVHSATRQGPGESGPHQRRLPALFLSPLIPSDSPTCIHVQVWLQELAHHQVRLVQQHEQQWQQQQQQQQQQQPAQDPNRRPSGFAAGMSQDDVTRLRELPVAVALAVQQQMGRRDLATGAMLGVAVVLVSLTVTKWCRTCLLAVSSVGQMLGFAVRRIVMMWW